MSRTISVKFDSEELERLQKLQKEFTMAHRSATQSDILRIALNDLYNKIFATHGSEEF